MQICFRWFFFETGVLCHAIPLFLFTEIKEVV